jgi:hypothetical protein
MEKQLTTPAKQSLSPELRGLASLFYPHSPQVHGEFYRCYNVRIELIDVLGNVVQEIRMESAQRTLHDVLDISACANGVYLVKISISELTAVQRLIRQWFAAE